MALLGPSTAGQCFISYSEKVSPAETAAYSVE